MSITQYVTGDVQYVAPDTNGGSDANDGLTWATPKLTVFSAWGAKDLSHTVDGTCSSAGVVTTVTFAKAFAVAPHVILTAASADAAATTTFVTTSTTGFTISCGALTAGASLIYHYMVMQ